jgi:hypothetical protein
MFDQPLSRQRQDVTSKNGLETSVASVCDSVPPTATPIESESTLSNPGTAELDYGLSNDNFLGQIAHIEEIGLDPSRHLSQLQYSPSKHGPDSIDEMNLNNSFDGNSFSATSTAGTTILDDENSFMGLFNDAFNNAATNNIFTNSNFQLDDYSYYYKGKELLPIYSPNLPTVLMAAATTKASTSPSSEIVIRGHFTKNKVKAGIQQTCATMIIDMICAYPRMMTRRETLPPFIHACSYAEDTEDDSNRLPEHLANCIGIAQLFAVRTEDTHSFVWTTIRAEIRGFRDRLRTFNKYDALSALQASLLYAIMRAVDDTPQNAGDDYEMLLIYDACSTLSFFRREPLLKTSGRMQKRHRTRRSILSCRRQKPKYALERLDIYGIYTTVGNPPVTPQLLCKPLVNDRNT